MLKILRNLLQKIINDIDADNSHITEAEQKQIIEAINEATDPKLSKYQACQLLNIQRSAFDKLVREGKLPRGIKQVGFKELFWRKTDIVKYLAMISN